MTTEIKIEIKKAWGNRERKFVFATDSLRPLIKFELYFGGYYTQIGACYFLANLIQSSTLYLRNHFHLHMILEESIFIVEGKETSIVVGLL